MSAVIDGAACFGGVMIGWGLNAYTRWRLAKAPQHVHQWGPWYEVPMVYPRVGKIFPEMHTVGQERQCKECKLKVTA